MHLKLGFIVCVVDYSGVRHFRILARFCCVISKVRGSEENNVECNLSQIGSKNQSVMDQE